MPEILVDESDLRGIIVRDVGEKDGPAAALTCFPLDRNTIVFVNRCVLMKLHKTSNFSLRGTTM